MTQHMETVLLHQDHVVAAAVAAWRGGDQFEHLPWFVVT